MSYYRGTQLGADDDLPREHFAQVGNFMGTRDDYLYPDDYGTRDIDRVGAAPVGGWVATPEQVRLRGTVDGRPGSKAIKQMLTTVDNGLVSEAMRLDGAAADDDHQMQVHPYRLPDDLPTEYCRFSRATLEQLQHYFCRKLAESSTVDTLIVDLSGGAFEPGDAFPGWWDAKARAYRAISVDNMSRQEFFRKISDLMLGHFRLHEDLRSQRVPPTDLKKLVKGFPAELTLSEAKKQCSLCIVELAWEDRDEGIRNQKWWCSVAEGEKAEAEAKKTKARSRGVNSVEEFEKTALQVRAERAEAALAQMQVMTVGGDQALGLQWQAEAAQAGEQFKQALQYQPLAQVNAVLPSPALTFRQQLQQELTAMGVITVQQGSPQVGQQQPQVQQQLQHAAPLTEVQQQVDKLLQAQQQGQGGCNSRNNGSNRNNGGGGGGGGGGYNNRRNNGGGNFNRQNQTSGSRGACFECGVTDHQVARCPQRQQRNQQFNGQQAGNRLFIQKQRRGY